MPWERMWFKTNKAYVHVDEQGRIIEENGKVEIRYKPDDTRSYKASRTNVRPLDDPPPAKAKPAPKPAQKKESKTSATPKPVSSKRATKAKGEPIQAWTDGACSGNPGPAGLGVVLLSGEHRLEISKYLGKSTNNVAELTAILVALQTIRTPSRPVQIYTDSTYSIGVLVKGWKAKKNPELIEQIRNEIGRYAAVEFIKVAGHAGVPENERADELARMAVTSKADSEQRIS